MREMMPRLGWTQHAARVHAGERRSGERVMSGLVRRQNRRGLAAYRRFLEALDAFIEADKNSDLSLEDWEAAMQECVTLFGINIDEGG